MAQQQFHPSFEDKKDFTSASRGLIAPLDPRIITASDGRIIWNADDFNFLTDQCPATVNPKLWRLGQVTSISGIFEVTSGVYQIRGYDISNMTVVEGMQGVIVIDPLTSVECAAAALSLYRKHRGHRPVSAVIYSHSHADHFGGGAGVLPSPDQVDIPIIAPEGFVEEATSENVYVGNAMRRRAAYMYGSRLPKSPTGQVGCGIGMAVSGGINSMIPPNVLISHTGEEMVVDGVRMVFQMVPGAEAPAEINFFLPDHAALYVAECATHTLHNILTLRGAQVRDAKAWARYLDEVLALFGEKSNVLFAGHQWPTWGTEEISKHISDQRDLYAYLHDQTVRMMNLGMTGIEIAEVITLPSTLQRAWHAQGFYGSVSHNVKAIYQRYMGWFDGNPAHLWEYPPKESAKRYVSCMGGIDEVVKKAEEFAKDGDLRFAATLLGHAVTLDPGNTKSRMVLASVFEQLGYGAENTTWRNFYLSGAFDLGTQNKSIDRLVNSQLNKLNPMQTVEQWFAMLSVRLDGPRAADENFVIDMHLADEKQWWRLIVSNGVLTYRNSADRSSLTGKAGLTLTLSKNELRGILSGEVEPEGHGEGDRGLLTQLRSLIQP